MQNPAGTQTVQTPFASITGHTVTGLLLAGGQGTRLGGVDKGLQFWRGRPLAQQVLARLAPQVDTVLVNCNRNQDAYAAFGYPLVSDLAAGFPGPLAGLQTGLQACRMPYLVTVPCDAPFVPMDLVARLLAAVQAASDISQVPQAAIAVQQQAGETVWQPVFALYACSVRASLEAFLQQGMQQVRRWQKSLPHVLVDFSDQPQAFANLNTPEEWAASETQVSG